MRQSKGETRQKSVTDRFISRNEFRYATDDELMYSKFVTVWIRGLGFRQMTPLALKVYQNSVAQENKNRMFNASDRWKLLTKVNK